MVLGRPGSLSSRSLDDTIRQLHLAMELPEFVQVLQGLLPTQEAENQLELLVAILDFQQAKPSRRGEIEVNIRTKFLLETSPLRVLVPAALLHKPQVGYVIFFDRYRVAQPTMIIFCPSEGIFLPQGKLF
jgi:hypothetical protein